MTIKQQINAQLKEIKKLEQALAEQKRNLAALREKAAREVVRVVDDVTIYTLKSSWKFVRADGKSFLASRYRNAYGARTITQNGKGVLFGVRGGVAELARQVNQV